MTGENLRELAAPPDIPSPARRARNTTSIFNTHKGGIPMTQPNPVENPPHPSCLAWAKAEVAYQTALQTFAGVNGMAGHLASSNEKFHEKAAEAFYTNAFAIREAAKRRHDARAAAKLPPEFTNGDFPIVSVAETAADLEKAEKIYNTAHAAAAFLGDPE